MSEEHTAEPIAALSRELSELHRKRVELIKELGPHRSKIENLETSRDFYREAAVVARREHVTAVGHAAILESEIQGEKFLSAPLETALKEIEASIDANASTL